MLYRVHRPFPGKMPLHSAAGRESKLHHLPEFCRQTETHRQKKEKKIIHRNPAFCAPAAPRGAPRQNSDEKNTRKGRKRKEGESLTQKIPPSSSSSHFSSTRESDFRGAEAPYREGGGGGRGGVEALHPGAAAGKS